MNTIPTPSAPVNSNPDSILLRSLKNDQSRALKRCFSEEEVAAFIKEKEASKEDIYYYPNEFSDESLWSEAGYPTDDSCTARRCLFLDYDWDLPRGIATIRELIKSLGVSPLKVVLTTETDGNGRPNKLQVVFGVAEEDRGEDKRELWKEVSRRLVHVCGADKGVCNQARFLRMPGTINTKWEGRTKEIPLSREGTFARLEKLRTKLEGFEKSSLSAELRHAREAAQGGNGADHGERLVAMTASKAWSLLNENDFKPLKLVGEGNRNNTLTSWAGELSQLVVRGKLTEKEGADRLWALGKFACNPPLPSDELRKLIFGTFSDNFVVKDRVAKDREDREMLNVIGPINAVTTPLLTEDQIEEKYPPEKLIAHFSTGGVSEWDKFLWKFSKGYRHMAAGRDGEHTLLVDAIIDRMKDTRLLFGGWPVKYSVNRPRECGGGVVSVMRPVSKLSKYNTRLDDLLQGIVAELRSRGPIIAAYPEIEQDIKTNEIPAILARCAAKSRSKDGINKAKCEALQKLEMTGLFDLKLTDRLKQILRQAILGKLEDVMDRPVDTSYTIKNKGKIFFQNGEFNPVDGSFIENECWRETIYTIHSSFMSELVTEGMDEEDVLDTLRDKAPMFWAVITQAFPDDERSWKLMLCLFAYCACIGNPCQKFFILVGDTGAGKSLLAFLLQSLIGPGDCATSVGYKTIDNDKGGLSEAENRLMAYIEEANGTAADRYTSNDQEKYMVLVKASTGGACTVRRLYSDPREVPIWCKMVMTLNTVPELKDEKGAIERRRVPFHFRNALPKLLRKDGDYYSVIAGSEGHVIMTIAAKMMSLNWYKGEGLFDDPEAIAVAEGREVTGESSNPVASFLARALDTRGRTINRKDSTAYGIAPVPLVMLLAKHIDAVNDSGGTTPYKQAERKASRALMSDLSTGCAVTYNNNEDSYTFRYNRLKLCVKVLLGVRIKLAEVMDGEDGLTWRSIIDQLSRLNNKSCLWLIQHLKEEGKLERVFDFDGLSDEQIASIKKHKIITAGILKT